MTPRKKNTPSNREGWENVFSERWRAVPPGREHTFSLFVPFVKEAIGYSGESISGKADQEDQEGPSRMHCTEKRSELYSGLSGLADPERRQVGSTGSQAERKRRASAESGLLR